MFQRTSSWWKKEQTSLCCCFKYILSKWWFYNVCTRPGYILFWVLHKITRNTTILLVYQKQKQVERREVFCRLLLQILMQRLPLRWLNSRLLDHNDHESMRTSDDRVTHSNHEHIFLDSSIRYARVHMLTKCVRLNICLVKKWIWRKCTNMNLKLLSSNPCTVCCLGLGTHCNSKEWWVV